MRHGLRTPASPPGSGQRGEVADALEAVVVGQQHLAAPDLHAAVGGGAVAGAVEREPEHRRRAVEAVLGHQRGDVGVVVLHVDHGAGVVLGAPTAG